MDPLSNTLIQLGVAGGALAVLRWFAGRVLDLLERRVNGMAEAVARMEPKVDEIHAAVTGPCVRLHCPDRDPPGDAA